MTASLVPVSFGPVMEFTQSEATAAERTWLFYLSNTADGTPATGKTIATTDFKISKNGAAFGNATGAVTEMSLGWYKMVFATADLDTLGTLACELSGEAGVDPIHVAHQVTLLDRNVATVPLAAGAIASTTFASGAITATSIAADAIGASELAADAVVEIQAGLSTAAAVAAISGLPVHNQTFSLGTLSADGHSSGCSMAQAVQAVVTATGTFGSGTIQVETCVDPTVTVPVWVAVSGLTLSSNGSKTVTGPVNAVRVALTGSTSPTIAVSCVVSTPRV